MLSETAVCLGAKLGGTEKNPISGTQCLRLNGACCAQDPAGKGYTFKNESYLTNKKPGCILRPCFKIWLKTHLHRWEDNLSVQRHARVSSLLGLLYYWITLSGTNVHWKKTEWHSRLSGCHVHKFGGSMLFFRLLRK